MGITNSKMKLIIRIQIIILLLIANNATLNAQVPEYALKADFIYKISKYCYWPNSRVQQDSFTIVIIGKNYFKENIHILSSKQIDNKPVKIQVVQFAEIIPPCNILFISDTEEKNLKTILNAIKGQPILTISDTDGFAQAGTCINFYYTNQQTLHFQFNPDAIKRSGIIVDLYLLTYGINIKEKNDTNY